MSEEVEKTIIEFDLTYGDSAKETEMLTSSLIDLREEITKNKQAQRELKKSGEDNSEQLKKLQTEELKLKDRLTDLNRERKKSVDITKIQAGTLEGLRKQTKALFAEREKVNTQTKEGSRRFAELTKQIKANNDKIKEADQSAGSYTSSIGSYKDALGSLHPQSAGFINSLQNTVSGLKSTRAGIGANTKSLGIFKTALISTGIGAIVVALGSLIVLLQKTQTGTDFLSKTMNQFGAVVDVIIGRFVTFAEGVLAFLSFDFETAFDKMGEAFSDIGEEISGAVEDAERLHEANIQLENDEARLAKNISERKKEIQELILLTRDETASFDERRKALEKANKLELENLNDAIDLQKQKLEIAKLELSSTPETLRTREQVNKITEEETALIDLQTQSLARQRELRNRVNELGNKEAADSKKRADEATKRTEEQRKSIAESQDEDFEMLEESIEKEEEIHQKKLEQDQLYADARLEIERQRLEEEEKLREMAFQSSRLISDTLFSALDANLKHEETRVRDSYDRRLSVLKASFKAGEISQEEYNEKTKVLEQHQAQELYKIELAKFRQKKAQSLANIAIDIAQAVAKVWAESGLAGIVTQALPIAAGVVQAGIVLSQPEPKPPTFREGGNVKSFLIGGNSHEAGGTTFVGSDGSKFEAEKDEAMFITKKGDSTLQALAYINSLNGGRGLDNVSRFYADGGSVLTTGSDVELIERTVAAVLQNVEIVTRVEDIRIFSSG